jgi:hypothetical protein
VQYTVRQSAVKCNPATCYTVPRQKKPALAQLDGAVPPNTIGWGTRRRGAAKVAREPCSPACRRVAPAYGYARPPHTGKCGDRRARRLGAGKVPEARGSTACGRRTPVYRMLDGSLPEKPPERRARGLVARNLPLLSVLDGIKSQRRLLCSTARGGRAPGKAVLDGAPPSSAGQDRP